MRLSVVEVIVALDFTNNGLMVYKELEGVKLLGGRIALSGDFTCLSDLSANAKGEAS